MQSLTLAIGDLFEDPENLLADSAATITVTDFEGHGLTHSLSDDKLTLTVTGTIADLEGTTQTTLKVTLDNGDAAKDNPIAEIRFKISAVNAPIETPKGDTIQLDLDVGTTALKVTNVVGETTTTLSAFDLSDYFKDPEDKDFTYTFDEDGSLTKEALGLEFDIDASGMLTASGAAAIVTADDTVTDTAKLTITATVGEGDTVQTAFLVIDLKLYEPASLRPLARTQSHTTNLAEETLMQSAGPGLSSRFVR